jgi:predicted kinase
MRVLAYYLCYRALVRAKVDAIRASQPGIGRVERRQAEEDLYGYLQLAQSYCRSRQARLIITRGMSASGKSTLTQPLLEQLGAIRLRSDVERKRLFGLKAEEDATAATGEGIYTTEASQRTYDRLVELASMVIDAGYPVIVDAACLKDEQREKFHQLAAEKHVPYLILEFTASPGTLRKRIVERQPGASDADLAVLEHQLATWQPLHESEEAQAIRIDTEATFDVLQLVEQITRLPTD